MQGVPLRTRVLRHRAAIRFSVLAALGVLLGHDAIFAADAAFGTSDREFAAVGHRYWPTIAGLVLLATAAVVAAGIAGLTRLQRTIRRLPAPVPAFVTRGPSYSAELLHLWPRLLLVVTLVFLLQENLEHFAIGETPPGLWALSAPGYPLAVPVLIAVTGLLAAIGAWLRHREAILIGRLRAARLTAALRRSRPVASYPRTIGLLLARCLLLARPDAGRAPPASAC